MPVIRVDSLSFGYQGMDVLSDISFEVGQGDYLGVVGPNGSGKSTLIKTLLGILQNRQGAIALFGQPQSAFRQWHRIGYLPQRLTSLSTGFPGTVEEIVRMGRTGADALKLKNILDMLGIAHLAKRMIGELSYGEQQRAMLARALISEPELLIFDEPTTALDPATRDIFYSLTRDINRSRGTTIILVTHDIGIIGQYARTLLYLDKTVVFSGTFMDFCASTEMTGMFGPVSQHIICHQHRHDLRSGD
ncbi:MAG: metal ABC transporter ATP-binding protein [Smithellaceae bacterium]